MCLSSHGQSIHHGCVVYEVIILLAARDFYLLRVRTLIKLWEYPSSVYIYASTSQDGPKINVRTP